MALVAFVLAAIEGALVGLGVDFPADTAVENLGVAVFLLALGLALPGAIGLVDSRRS